VKFYTHSAMSCAEMAKPIELPFGLRTWVGPKQARVQSYSPNGANAPPMGLLCGCTGATWRIRFNCLRWRWGLMSNYSDHLLLLGCIAVLCTYMLPVVTDLVARSVSLSQ